MKKLIIIIAIIIIIVFSIWFEFSVATSDLPFWVKYLLLK